MQRHSEIATRPLWSPRRDLAQLVERSQPSTLTRAPWRVFGSGDVVELHRPRRGQLIGLPPGTRVCLVDDRLLSRPRLRRLARRTRLEVERELIAVPSPASPLALVDDDADAVRLFWTSIGMVPPGLDRMALPAAVALALMRRLSWTWTGVLVPGRIVIGRLS